MDPSSLPAHRLSPTVSPEPSTTRPNPFDDGDDGSSRKRRRTSASGSPSASAETMPSARPAAPSDSDQVNGVHSASTRHGDEANFERDPYPPRPSDHQPAPSGPAPPEQPPPPPSSQVTINLRNAQSQCDDPASPSAASPPPSPQREPCESIMDEAEIKKSVEDSESDLAHSLTAHSAASQASSSSSSASVTPPIEVSNEQETHPTAEYDGMSFSSSNVEASIFDHSVAVVDPMERFPYYDFHESLTETVSRLTRYITLQTPLDSNVIEEIRAWIVLFLKFANQVGLHAAMDSCRRHRNFWLALQDVFLAPSNRKPSNPKSAAFQTALGGLYSGLAELTAFFVNIDYLIIVQWRTSPYHHVTNNPPPLFSLGYLQHFHILMRHLEVPMEDDPASESVVNMQHRADQVTNFVGRFQRHLGGSLEPLCKLAIELMGVIRAFPRIIDSLVPVVQGLTLCLRFSCQVLLSGNQDPSLVKQQLKRGHELWHSISSFMNTSIENHSTHFSNDSASSEINALTEMLRWCLEGDHRDAVDLLREHREKYPQVLPMMTCEAISWEWKIGIFGKLVRCGQMQLRVMAVTNLCGDLVTIYKKLGDASEEHFTFLRHLASYLLEINLIDYILSPNCHPEIIFEGANIVGFLVVAKLYTTEHTDRLWQGITASQNPRVADALIRLTATLTNLFEFSDLLGLCAKFETVPIEAFNPSLRHLWDNLMGDLVARSQMEQKALTFLPFNLCLRLLRESSSCAFGTQVANPEMQHAAMEKFRFLLANGSDPGVRQQLYLSCVGDLAAKSRTTLGSLWCLILTIGPQYCEELRALVREQDLARLVVEELEHAVAAGRSAGVPAVLSGSSHQPRREFISSLIHLEPSSLANDLGTRLWDILVGRRCPCPDDRKFGWQIISNLAGNRPNANLFLQMCVSQLLPQLPRECFSEGMLEFVKAQVSMLVSAAEDCALDDEEFVGRSIIEQLWRIMLAADDLAIVELAIHTIAIEVYLDNKIIMSYPHDQARQVHLSLVIRCLRQMEIAASQLKASSDGMSSNEGEAMVTIASDKERLEQERIFTRTLKFLQYFMDAHHLRPHYSPPDLRLLILHEPESCQVEGDLAQLKYQSFDHGRGTAVKPLHIGKLNTAASLLASLRRETGFQNYRMFYRGRQFLPLENEICKSLEDLQLHDGLILVNRERDPSPGPVDGLRPDTSPLDIKLLAHFPELREYLSMDEQIAKEVFNFLVKLPADGHIMNLFESNTTAYQDIFLPGQTFQSLYAIHALGEYVEAAKLASARKGCSQSSPGSYDEALGKALHLIVQAISDQKLVESTNSQMRVQLLGSLMAQFVKLLPDFSPFPVDSSKLPSADRLVTILRDAINVPDEGAVSLVTSTLCSILRLGVAHAQFWAQVTSHPDFRPLLGRLILFDDRRKIREVTLGLIKDAVGHDADTQPDSSAGVHRQDPLPSNTLASYFWTTVSSLLTEAIRLPSQCVEFFEIARFLRCHLSVTTQADMRADFLRFAAETSTLLLGHTSTEEIDQIRPLDSVAQGLFSLLHLSMQLDHTLPSSNLLQKNLAETLFWCHLFPPRRSEATTVSKVLLNVDTRAQIYEIIFRLIRSDRTKLNALILALKSLVAHHPQDEDDLHFEVPFQFSRMEAVRSPCGYVGLRNLSNTCYLNSLLTQLFMNTPFRSFIMRSKIKGLTGSQRLLFETQKLFGFMQESFDRFIDPTSFVESIRNYDDTSIDPNVQMDVDEFYNLLFDRWEGQFPTSDGRKAFRSFYGGQLVQQVKSKECEHISERVEPFFAIQCDIKGKSTLDESLQAYVDGELMEGDNKYKCSTCDKHVDAVKRACLKDIPDHLIFHLKRFDFNLRTMLRSKINDYFSFPAMIDMQPYTIKHLSNPVAENEENADDLFELVGILVHSGTAESGHYYSYIRERPTSLDRPEWVEFNDETVTPWDPSMMESSTFGGPNQRPHYDANGNFFDKNYSAYMLFYQRASSLAKEQQAMSTGISKAPLRVGIDEQLMKHLQNVNTMALRRHCLFDPNHLTLAVNCFSQARAFYEEERAALSRQLEAGDVRELPHVHEQKDLAMDMALGHFDQIASRNKDLSGFEQFAPRIRSAIENCADCALAFYRYFYGRAGAFRAMLQRNPDAGVRTFIGQAFLLAQIQIANRFPELYYPSNINTSGNKLTTEASHVGYLPFDKSVLEGVMMIANELWKHFHAAIRSWDDFFGLLLGLAQMGDVHVAHLLANDFLLRTLRIFVASHPKMGLPICYMKMMDNIFRRPNNRPPKFTSLLALIDYLLQHLEPVLGAQYIVETPMERLEYHQAPFPWTSDEVSIIHENPDQILDSYFVERLLAIEDPLQLPFQIIDRLVATGDHMDSSVLNVLRRKLEGDTTTEPMDPYLHYASRYLGITCSIDHAQALIRHISAQSKTLQHAEGLAFLSFFDVALNSQREGAEISRAIRECTIATIPAWAPYLLTYADDNIRHGAEQLMSKDIFALLASESDGHAPPLIRRSVIVEATQKLGMVCLGYLRNTHINQCAPIGRGRAATILRVIEKCASSSKPNAEDDDMQVELNDVISQLRKLIVDDIDDDNSEWDGSCASSEPFEGLQPVQELEDAKLE